jgi:hypothetical protein
VFVAPDTGHRYVTSAFARHADMPAAGGLVPTVVTDCAGVRLPWSVTDWADLPEQRRAAPLACGIPGRHP